MKVSLATVRDVDIQVGICCLHPVQGEEVQVPRGADREAGVLCRQEVNLTAASLALPAFSPSSFFFISVPSNKPI